MKRVGFLILLFLVSYLSTSAQINKIGYGKFIKNWLILGPFPGREIDQDYLESIGGESSIDPKVGDIVETKQGKSLAWSFYGSQDNTINLLKAIGNYENVTAYAFCYVKSDRDLKSELFSLGGDDQTAVWFNGKLVNQNSTGRRLVVDQDSFPVEIKRGKNRLLIKVTQRKDSWEFVGRFQLGASGHLFALDGTTPHINVVVQALKDNQIVETVLSDQNGYYQLALPGKGSYTFRCQVLKGYIYYNSSAKQIIEGPSQNIVVEKGIHNQNFYFPPFRKGSWRHYTYLDGLAGNNITTIYQARDRTLWIGTTAGLSIFDGQSFTNLTTKDGLVNNHVSAIHQVMDGTFWIGTLGGLSHYNGQDFTNFTIGEGLVSNVVSDIYQTGDGMLWITTKDTETGKKNFFDTGSGTGICRYDGRTFTSYSMDDGLASNLVNDVHQSQDGSLWFATASQRLGLRQINGGISRYDGQTFSTYTTEDGLLSNNVNYIAESRDGIIWLATDQGISSYDGKKFTNHTVRDGLPANQITNVLQTSDNALWFATNRGLVRYFQNRFVIFQQIGRPLNREVVTLFESDDGTLWVSELSGGLSAYNQQIIHFGTKDGLVNNRINLVHKAGDGSLWFGSASGGLSRFDGENFSNFLLTTDLPNLHIISITETSNGTLWFGYRGGASSFDGQVFQHLSVADGLGQSVHAVYEDKDKNMWFGTWSEGKSLSTYDGQRLRTFKRSDGLATNNVTTIYQSVDESLWFATYGKGVFRYNGEKFTQFTTEDGLASDIISSIFVTDSFIESIDGTLWCRSLSGPLSRFDGQRFKIVTTQDGFVNNMVNCTYKSKDGSVWFGTDGGVTKYDGKQFISLTTSDGLGDNQITAIYEASDEIVWFGTKNGGVSLYDGNVANYLDTRDGLPDNYVIQITGDDQGGVYIGTGGENTFNFATKAIGSFTRYQRSNTGPVAVIDWVKTDELYTNLDDIPPILSGNLVTFKSRAIDFKTLAEKRRYQYRIREFQDWSLATLNDTYERKFNQPGHYTFEVRAIDRDLFYSEVTSVNFQVVAPWFLNIWIIFPTVSSILLAFALALVNGIRYYQQRQESEQLRDKILERERDTRLALESELADAHQMQMALLPKSAPLVPGLQTAGRNIGAKEVGGDFFDYLQNGEQFVIAVGDVSGKGLKGAMNAVMTSGILKLSAEYQDTPSSIVSEINKSLCQSIERDMNVTMVLAQFDPQKKKMTLVNAGQHAYPLLKRSDSVEPIQAKGLALGMIPAVPYNSLTVDLKTGDLLLFMTDGITEPRNDEGVMYEESGRFHQIISDLSEDLSAEEVVETIIQDVINYMADEEDRDDDITLVAVKVT